MSLVDTVIRKVVRKKTAFHIVETADQYIKKRDYKFNAKTKELYIIFHPWRGKEIWCTPLKNNLYRNGFSYLEYTSSPNILCNNPAQTHQCFISIASTVRDEIRDLKATHGFTKVHVIGISLSCVTALLIANENNRVDTITLVCPGHDIAESLWNGSRTREFRDEFEKSGMTLETLKKQWKDLAPMNNLHHVKHVTVYLSHSDTVIPYSYGNQLVTAMKSNNIQPIVIENKHLGHYGTILGFNFLWSWKIK